MIFFSPCNIFSLFDYIYGGVWGDMSRTQPAFVSCAAFSFWGRSKVAKRPF